MITHDEIVKIGVFNKPHGVDGEISATLDCDWETAQEFSCFICNVDGIYVPFFVDAVRSKAASVLMKVNSIDSADAVRFLVNKKVYVLKREYDDLLEDADDEEIPTQYFIGYKMYDGERLVGEIVDIDTSTENILFVVEGADGEELLVPAVDDLVEAIDTEGKTITMSLPNGLLDM